MTPEQRYKCMSSVHSSSTKPELLLRRRLWRLGYRYRVNDKRLPGKPDIVLPKYRTVVFVHGCFWHGHKGCNNYSVPKSNTDFWKDKITRNQERDQETWRKLEAKGWAVIVVWECQLKKATIEETIAQVEAEIKQNGESLRIMQDERRKSRERYQQDRRLLKEREIILRKELEKQFPM